MRQEGADASSERWQEQAWPEMLEIVGVPRPGVTLPPFRRTAGFHAWNHFAAVNDEFVDIHMDDEGGKAAGMPGAIGMGNLVWAWLHAAVADWVGERGNLEHLDIRFRRPAARGTS